MPDLQTREQAVALLAEMSPTETFNVQPFRHGWVCTTVLTPEQMASGASVGLARLVIDSQTGTVWQYPSWSTDMVAEAHTEFKETGVSTAGRQIYPHQWEITVRRVQETTSEIIYQLTAESLTEPPEPVKAHHLTIEKQGHQYDPRDPWSRVAMVHARWLSRQNHGVWPEVDTTRM